jgi:V/A-type H+-transporting ATPase subunit E
MELQIQDLVNSIKRDGIEEAEKKAAEIIGEAQEKADDLVRNAKKEAQRIVDEAKKEVAVMKQSGTAAVQQAGRDVMLSLKKQINDQFTRILEQQVSSTFSGKDLVTLIVSVVSSGLVTPEDTVVEINEKQKKQLAESLQHELAKELKAGLEIKVVPSVDIGFRLTAKDGSSYYDFSTDEVVRLLAPFLNTAVRDMLTAS